MRENFDTTNQRESAEDARRPAAFSLRHYRHKVLVSVLVVLVLAGGALYASRVSEKEPKVVYSASLAEISSEANEPLMVNINTAEEEELEELPGVGPATAEAIVRHRRANGPFGSVEELEEVSGIGPATLGEIEPLAEV